ncbi:MAG: transcription antitermination factor NusB [Oscillospiraceae bacterium]|nr:transcription antitermination factor NusB [Oscillospiraceae bacterium]
MTRREAREQAFVLLFEYSFQQTPIDEVIANAVEGRDIEVDPFARALAAKATEQVVLLDAQIEKYSKKWKKNRISRVALAILRLSVCELMFEDGIPASVSINEAVELAKKFGGEEDSAFVNGVLGAVYRGMGGEEAGVQAVPEQEPSALEPAGEEDAAQ